MNMDELTIEDRKLRCQYTYKKKKGIEPTEAERKAKNKYIRFNRSGNRIKNRLKTGPCRIYSEFSEQENDLAKSYRRKKYKGLKANKNEINAYRKVHAIKTRDRYHLKKLEAAQ